MIDVPMAALAGLLAAQVMELPAYAQRFLGLPVSQDIFAETGAIVRAPAPVRRLVGWVGHAVTAAIVAVAYAVFFAVVDARPPTVWWGLVAAVFHSVIGGLVIAAYPRLHPDVPARLPAPGFAYRRWGWPDVVTFVIGHLVYGTMVAVLYRTLARGAAIL